MIKPYAIQSTLSQELDIPKLARVDYAALSKTLRFPVLWVYEHYLQAWLPREVDQAFIDRLKNYSGNDERFERRLDALGLLENDQHVTWENLKERMSAEGYVVIKSLFPLGLCKQLSDYYFRQPESHDRWHDMPGIKRTSVNNSPLMRLMHQSTERLMRYVLGEVKTSYSFTSAYETGTILPRHTDRPQCVYNASVILSVDPLSADPKRWPLYIEIDSIVHAASLGIGDAVVYSGVKDPHWRDTLPPDVHGLLGTFFHYVPVSFDGGLD